MLVCVMCWAVAGVCVCVCVKEGVLCFCPDQLAEMGYYGDSACCAHCGIRSFPHFSISALSPYICARMHEGTGRTAVIGT